MQVFVPLPNFNDSRKVLDKKRLFKQVIEIRQILAGMGMKVEKNDGTFYRPTHKNHPIYKTWEDQQGCLMHYHDLLLYECQQRNIKTNIKNFFPDSLLHKFDYPSWWGREDFHSRHRAALLAKNPEWYGQFGWSEEPKIDYVWK